MDEYMKERLRLEIRSVVQEAVDSKLNPLIEAFKELEESVSRLEAIIESKEKVKKK
ncbi:MAG: hypothetical protein ACE5KT_11715 [Methanosarcinales archaeon]